MTEKIENKKVRGTKIKEYNGIKFKSTLECNCYKMLEKSGLKFSHEAEKFTIWEGFKPTISIWAPSKITGTLRLTPFMNLQPKKLISITYTPDFIVELEKYKFFIDSKGNPNDVYPYKKKMFLKLLESMNSNYKYFFMEPHNLRQMKQTIDIIKSYEES